MTKAWRMGILRGRESIRKNENPTEPHQKRLNDFHLENIRQNLAAELSGSVWKDSPYPEKNPGF